MSARTNLVLQLNYLARQIDLVAEKLRKPEYDPEASSILWHLCATHQRLMNELLDQTSRREFPRGTERVVPLPKYADEIWGVEKRAPGVVAAIHNFLSEDEEVTAVEVPERLRWNLARTRKDAR